MNAVFTMILRNLRTELEHTDQAMRNKDKYIQELEAQIKTSKTPEQQRQIEEVIKP